MRKLFFAGVIALALSSNAIAQQAVTIRQSNGAGPVPATAQGLTVRTLDGADATQGSQADSACATDNGACSIAALLKRGNQRQTSILTALGSPFQAGANIGNTSFGISGTLPAFAVTPTFNVGTIAGIATAANQATEITSLSTIATNGTGLNTNFGAIGATAYNGSSASFMAMTRAIADAAISAADVGVNIKTLNGVTVASGSGVNGTGVQRTVPPTDAPTYGAPGATAPAISQLVGVQTGVNMSALVQTGINFPIDISTASTTVLVPLSGSTQIRVTAFDVIAGGTGNFRLVSGAGSLCATSQANVTGNYNLTAQAGIAKGNGGGVLFILPAGHGLCAITSAAVNMAGSVSAAQF